MTRRRRGRGLSEEDRALWARVAASATPLPGRDAPEASQPPETAEAARAPRSDADGGAPPPPPPRPSTAAPTPAPATRRSVRPEGRPLPPMRWTGTGTVGDRPAPLGRTAPGIDRGTVRRLAKGRREPEAKLDLHGMTLDRAHRALTRFLLGSRAAGLRCVLVITGKGGGEGGRGDGLLRRDVPRWITVAPLDEAVVGVFEAHPKHGGGGALYVYLKRPR